MRNLVSEYVSQFRQDRQKQLKLAAVLAALAVVVAGVVFWQLHNTGVAMSNEVYCGMEEHVHDDSCYEHELICDSEEEGHVHDDSCYATVLVCDIPEHTHTAECLVDETADVETASVWEETLPASTGIWSQDVVSVAESQVGYTESTLNYTLAEDGTTHQGYSRYGAWYGNEYGDWDAMFVSFCLNYAGVPEEEFPESSGAYAWTADLNNYDLYTENENFTPAAGDLIFFDEDYDGTADRVGLITDIDSEEGTITVIEGNSNDAVEENVYNASDAMIIGFGLLPEQDLGGKTVYTIEYDSDEPEYLEISGPEQALEDADLTFFVTVDLNNRYDITEATVNGEELDPASITVSDDGQIYTYEYTVENVDENMAVFLAAKQVIDGSGETGIFKKISLDVDDPYTGEPDYTLIITDVPTNTKISLDSPHITLKDQSGDEVENTLQESLYFLSNREDPYSETTEVSYLMLDGPDVDDPDYDEDAEYIVTPYDENDQKLTSENGILILDLSKVYVSAVFEMIPVQTNTLCYQDETNDNAYSEKLIGATAVASSQSFTATGSIGDRLRLAQVSPEHEKFYCGSLDPVDGEEDTVNLTEVHYVEIVESPDGSYTAAPVDDKGQVVEGDNISIYMVADEVYSFDVKVNSIVNEHSEDDGHVYFWTGGQYYVDQFYNMGGGGNYYVSADADDDEGGVRGSGKDKGVFVQLATIRTPLINSGEKSFADYASVKKGDLLEEGVTEYIVNKVSANYNYGIAGPYEMDSSQTEITYETKRVTGHIGDEFTAMEAFNSEYVYMVTDSSTYDAETNPEGQYHAEWTNMGLTGPGYGVRNWWYWIKDYYKLSNYEDLLEYVEITERYENDEIEIHLEADEMGAAGLGEEFDIWNIDLYTKRVSVIKQYMMDHQDEFTADGVGFSAHAYEPTHFQLRMEGTVETIIDNELYFGELTAVTDETTNGDGDTEYGQYAPYLEYALKDVHSTHGGDEFDVSHQVYIDMKNGNEAESVSFKAEDGTTSVYVALDNRFNTDKVQFKVTVYYEGTLTSKDGTKTIEYGADTANGYFKYEATLTEGQLREAYDTCPNNSGYDFAVNLSAAIQNQYESTDLTLYKIWDDSSNRYDSRNVDSVTVNMERSGDGGVSWEDVPITTYDEETKKLVEQEGTTMEFTIPAGNAVSDIWSLTVTSNEINLTYTDENDETYHYDFRIKSESENLDEINEKAGEHTYSASYSGLTVRNTIDVDTIVIAGEKIWLDMDGNELSEDILPEEVTLAVYQDGQFYQKQVVTKEEDWSFKFEGLPRWKNGTEAYTYDLYELNDDGTIVEQDGQTLLDNHWYKVTIEETGNDGETVEYAVTNTLIDVSLPVTGGAGTWIFTVAGVCLIGGASVALVYRKRRAVRS